MIISETPATDNPNPNSKSKTTNAYHIGGIQVDFPYRPYGTQLAFMGRVISTLDRRCHALLESPTGTGKSLSLLCSTLAWQRNFATKMSQPAKPDPRSMTEPLDHGGGFVPEDDDDIADYDEDGPSSLRATGIQTKGTVAPEAHATDKKSNKRKKKPPTIYYASRTHSQISQVIREYRKTSYRVPMAVLGSKKHYCTNPKVRGNPNMEEQCKQLLSKKNPLCPEFKNYSGVKCHPSLQKGGLHEVHDIEDLVKVGEAVQGCSYYAARSMARDANLVFCPYNYVVNPVIRGAMEVDIRGAIIVLDEAHNMEDMARDAGSVDIDEETLLQLDKELEVLCEVDDMYPPLYEMTQGLLSWIDRRKKMLVKRDFQLYVSCWTGDKALTELEEANIFQNSFQALLGCATSAIRVATDQEEENVQHITGAAVQILEGLFSSLTYFFSRDGSHMSDYQLALRKHVKKDAGRDSDEWTNTISLWCLNPAVVFKDIAELSLSVILTSGTLSPMDSFSSELGVQFGTSLEAQHVIDINTQVWPAIISTGRSNLPLNASYRTAHEYDFQDSLGKSLEDIFRTVPGGCLVFFPSYKLMEKLSKRWCETGQWSQLNATKALFVEPRGGNQDDFETVLRGYYDAVRGVNKPLPGRRKRIKKVENFSNQFVDNGNATGAALLAVCRGKVSEGIDFSDDNARVVIIVGIPFPNVNDIQVDLKKKYNDTYKSSKNLLSGSEWYCYQAFRALNQAAGRCIRHSSDYGAIIFLDERYREKRNRAYVSKWLRNSIRQYDSFDLSLQELKSFFSNVKERVSKNTVNASDISGCNEESSPRPEQSKGCTRKQDKELNKSGHCSQKQLSLTQCNASFGSFKSQPSLELQKMDEDVDKTQEVVELYSSQEDSGYPETLPNALSLDDPEEAFVMETPFAGFSATSVSSLSCSKGEAAPNVSNRLSFDPLIPVASCSKVSPKSQCLDEFTPQKNPSVRTGSKTIRIEPHLNLSVNSCSQKRRKSISPSAFCLIEEQHDRVENYASDCTNFISNSLAYGDTTRRIDLALDSKLSEETSRSIVSPLGITNSAASSSGLAMNKRLHIRCSFCENPLGLPDNQHFVECYSNSSSKAHLESLHRKISRQSMRTSEGIPVLIVDIASVHQQLFSRTLDGDSELCKWCEKDGCVFKTIFCPFCPTLERCLFGVQVMATDASNTHLLNKIIFFADQLEIKTFEASSPKPIKDKDTLPVSTSSKEEMNSFERFLYNTQDSSRGWITTKSKLKLPKRGHVPKAED